MSSVRGVGWNRHIDICGLYSGILYEGAPIPEIVFSWLKAKHVCQFRLAKALHSTCVGHSLCSWATSSHPLCHPNSQFRSRRDPNTCSQCRLVPRLPVRTNLIPPYLLHLLLQRPLARLPPTLVRIPMTHSKRTRAKPTRACALAAAMSGTTTLANGARLRFPLTVGTLTLP